MGFCLRQWSLFGRRSSLQARRNEAQTVFDKFLTAFTAADIDNVVGVFWPDALFWGPTAPNLANTSEAVREYFKPVSGRKPNEMRATSLERSALVVSDSVVLISGPWQIERVVDGKLTLTLLRVSLAVTRRGEAWRVAQFHSSAQPSR